jgi:hypothetical protein
MKGQKLLWEQHDVRQGKQGKFPDRIIRHGRRVQGFFNPRKRLI